MKNIEESSVELSFFTLTDMKNRYFGERILSILTTSIKDLFPEFVDFGKGWRPISPNNLEELMTVWLKSNNLLFSRRSKYWSQFAVLLSGSSIRIKPFTLWVDNDYFSSEEHIQSFIIFSMQLYEVIHPEFGFIHAAEDKIKMSTFMHPKFGHTVLPINLDKGIPGIYWANFFGPKLIEAIGRDRLLAISWTRVENLSDNGLLALTGPSPLDDSPRDFRKKLERDLGKEYFYNIDNNDL